MKQLNEIFQNWSDTLEDSPEVLAAWKAIEIELELLQNDKIQDLIFAYSTTLQKEAFCAGYKKGMLLIMGKGQILRSTPNTAPLICGACNTQPEGLLTMA